MTRQPYNVRLALGRSAYEPLDEDTENAEAYASENVPSSSHVRQDGNRGNSSIPGAPSAEEVQIRAMNEVLEAVGVCERRNRARTDTHQQPDRLKLTAEEWADIREAEHEVGDNVFLFADMAHLTTTWWLETLLARIQAGLVSPKISFEAIMVSEWRYMISPGLKHAFGYLSAGAGMEALHRMLVVHADEYLQFSFGDVRLDIQRLGFRVTTRRFLIRNIRHAKNFASTLLHLYLSPLAVYAILAQLHLVDSPYGFPPLASFLPWHPLSPLQWGWSSGFETASFSSRLFTLCTSPVSLILARNVIYDWTENYGNIFEDEEGNTVMLCPRNDPRMIKPTLSNTRKEGNTIWSLVQKARDSFLDICGWSPRSFLRYQEQMGITNDTVTGYRNSTLACAPAEVLGRRLHCMMWRILLLPLEGMVVRAVARSWLSSGLVDRYRLGPAGTVSLFNFGWRSTDMMGHMSNVGLCLGIQSLFDSGLFQVTHMLTKWLGKNRFYWGRT